MIKKLDDYYSKKKKISRITYLKLSFILLINKIEKKSCPFCFMDKIFITYTQDFITIECIM